MSATTITELQALVRSLHREYVVACHPDDLSAVGGAIASIDTGPLVLVHVRPNRFIERGQVFLMDANRLLFTGWDDKP